MGRLALLGAALALVVLSLAPQANAAWEVRLSVVPGRPSMLEPTRIVFRTYVPVPRADGSCCRLEDGGPRSYPFRVEAVSPTGRTFRVTVKRVRANLWRGVFRFPKQGRWQVRVANYASGGYSVDFGARPRISVRVAAPRPTPAPAGFGPIGRAGCGPASPARDAEPGSGFREIFGTAVGGEQLWALPFLPDGASWARPDRAEFDGLVGKGVKIVFATALYATPFHAVGPNGIVLEPVWRQGHSGPTWVGIPGQQWGARFVFPEAGCWRVRVGTRGDVWMRVRS